MIVDTQFRNQAIGTQLLNYAIAHAQQTGCGRITLLTDAANISAQRFYRRFGFTHSAMLPMRLFLDGCAQTTAE
jgi:ribosomal protein S18 acetylase RimI-like enzyme